MRIKFYVTLLTVVLVFSSANQLMAQQIQPSAIKQIQSLIDEKQARTPVQKKISSQLLFAAKQDKGQRISSEIASLNIDVKKDATGKVPVTIRVENVTAGLLQLIKNSGGEILTSSPEFKVVSAKLPLESLEQIAALSEVKHISFDFGPRVADTKNDKINNKKFVPSPLRVIGETPFRKDIGGKKFSPAFEMRAENISRQVLSAMNNSDGKTDFIGGVTSQGDATHKAALARTTFGVNGAGIKIGILSDSYDTRPTGNNASDNVLSGDLPGLGNPNGFTTPVTILSDTYVGTTQNPSTDEGRAMLQIVHDIAPGAQLYFATAFTSEVSFAQNILNLRAAGCDIICDDVFYYDEPAFQDGIVAQAVNTVTASGALYFSSAGNQGNKNDLEASVWEGDYLAGTAATTPLSGGTLHDFGGLSYNQITFNGGAPIFLFWSDPFLASDNDYDLFVLNSTMTTVIAVSDDTQDGDDEAIEAVNPQAAGNRIVVLKVTSAATRAIHLNTFGSGINFTTGGQTHGHSAAVAAYSVAATPAAAAGCSGFTNGPSTTPFTGVNKVECYSSDGPRKMFYTAAGTPISGGVTFASGGGEVRQKPDITAADGTFTTVPGFASFYGTSAAAPHAAAIAALVKQKGGTCNPITPAQIRTALTSTSIDIEAAGIDRDAGVGIIMAFEAVQSVAGPTVTINQKAGQADPTSVTPVEFTVVFSSAVTGFTNTDITLGGTAGATTAAVTGSGTTYNVAVSGMTLNGTVIASIGACKAVDASSRSNEASTSTDNTITYNLPVAPGAPTVTINQATTQADPTNASPINFTVVFSEAVTGFATGDVTLIGTSGATTATVTGNGATYNVAVTGMTTSGTVIASIGTNVAVSVAASIGNAGSTSTDNTVNYDVQLPVITCPANITTATTVGSCTKAVTYTLPTVTDNLPGAVVTLVSGPVSGANFPVGVTTVTYKAVDAAGNSSAPCSFTVTVTDAQLPVINTQPANQPTCLGSTATFSLVVTNAVSYQWQQFTGGVWTNIIGATNATLAISNVTLSMNTNTYRVIVTNLCGTAVTSNAATLFVNPLPTISLTTTIAALLPTQTTSITATVSPAGGTFVWFKNGVALVPAVTGGTLPNLTVDNAGTYKAVYTDPNGCVSTSADLVISAAPSNNLYIAPNPNFGQFWVRFYNQQSEQLTLQVFNSNGTKVYQKAVTTTLAYTRIDVDLRLNAPGIYIVELRNSAGKLLASKKMIVNHP